MMNHGEIFLRGLNKDFYHKTVSSKQVEDYLSIKLNRDLSFFDQYLRDTKILYLHSSSIMVN